MKLNLNNITGLRLDMIDLLTELRELMHEQWLEYREYPASNATTDKLHDTIHTIDQTVEQLKFCNRIIEA